MSSESLLLEVRPRRTVFESYYVEHLHSSTRFLIAEREDFNVIMQYVSKFVDKNDGGDSVYAKNIKECLKKPFTILATDCFEICGIIAGRFLKNENSGNNGHFQIELLSVSPDYQHAGIGTKLLKELLRLVQKSEVSCVSLISTDLITRKLAEKFKMERKSSIPSPTNNLVVKHQKIEVIMVDLNEIGDLLKEDPPSLPNAYKLPNLKRRRLEEHFAKALGRPLQYFVAEPEDADVVKDFLMNEYFRQTAVTRTLQCRKVDGLQLVTRFKPELLKLGTTFIAVDNGKICGLAVNKLIKVDRPIVKLDERIPDDFTEEIDKQPLNHLGSKAIKALCGWMDSLTVQMLPEDCNRYYVLDMLTVHPTYRGCKIGWKLWAESLKHSMELGYRYTQTICTAIASNKLATDFGMKNMIEFPYIQLTYKGNKLFEDGTVYDGGKRICMYIGDSSDLKLDN